MPDDPTPSPAADATAGATAVAPPQPAPAPFNHRSEWSLSNVFGDGGEADAPNGTGVSNGEGATPPAPVEASAPDDKPAPEPSEGVKASDAPGPGSEPPAQSADPAGPLSRRQQEAARKDARIAALEAQVAERESPTYREQVRQELLAEQQRASAEAIDEDFLGNEDQFQAALRIPDNDPRLNQLAPDGKSTLYDWREERKERRERYSPVERHFQAIYDRKLAEATAQANDRSTGALAEAWQIVKADLGEQIAASAKIPGVDPSAFQQEGATWQTMAEHISEVRYAAGAADKEAELAERLTKAETEVTRLTKLNEDANADRLRDTRTVGVVGRTAGAAPHEPVFDHTRSWQENLNAAFATNGTG